MLTTPTSSLILSSSCFNQAEVRGGQCYQLVSTRDPPRSRDARTGQGSNGLCASRERLTKAADVRSMAATYTECYTVGGCGESSATDWEK